MEDRPTADVYDPELLQQTWLPVWDELQPFRSGDLADARRGIADVAATAAARERRGDGEEQERRRRRT